jgi:hypothetical protein
VKHKEERKKSVNSSRGMNWRRRGVVRGKNQEKEERKRKIRKRNGARDMRKRKRRVQKK